MPPAVALVEDRKLSDWSNPWKLTVEGLVVEARFATPEAVYGFFFGEHARWTLDPVVAEQLREILLGLGVVHQPDPRRRSMAELEKLPVGAVLSYHGQGETFVATKLTRGRWVASCSGGTFDIPPPTMPTSEVKP